MALHTTTERLLVHGRRPLPHRLRLLLFLGRIQKTHSKGGNGIAREEYTDLGDALWTCRSTVEYERRDGGDQEDGDVGLSDFVMMMMMERFSDLFFFS